MSSAADSARAPALTIAIPFFNPGVFFLPALQSVFAQEFQDWELLLIDDGGTDGSLAFATCIDDTRVRVIADGSNRGLSYRLNQAAQLARGQYLFRMDADDIMHPDRLASQLALLRASSPDTVVGAACYSIDEKSKVVGWRPASASQTTGFAARYSFVHPTVAAPTGWFRRNPYSEDYLYRRAEDAELWCRTSSHTQFKWIPEPLLFYREVGVFSLKRYLAGQEAILDMIRAMETTPIRRWSLLAREHVKMGLFRILSALHRDDLIVRHRYQKLASDKVTQAQRHLDRIMRTSIPLL